MFLFFFWSSELCASLTHMLKSYLICAFGSYLIFSGVLLHKLLSLVYLLVDDFLRAID